HVRSAADAKDYLANLMRPGSNTRAQFMAYQNHLYEQRSLAQHH
ncbi:MAG: FERM and PDZ domain-containing protein 3, partial [Segatella oris]